MSTTTTQAGSGPVDCECGNHRNRCRFGRPHTWAAPWYDDNGVLQRAFRCQPCGSVCTAEELISVPNPETTEVHRVSVFDDLGQPSVLDEPKPC